MAGSACRIGGRRARRIRVSALTDRCSTRHNQRPGSIQYWFIKPRLKNVPGVVEVNSIGGFEKQYHVTPYPDRLVAFRLTFRDLVEALEKNNGNIGAGYIEKNGEQYLIRFPGQVRTLSDIRGIVVATRDGQAIRIGDVADVIEASELRTGAATRNGEETGLGD